MTARMTNQRRAHNYYRQNRCAKLTARQRRRMRHHDNWLKKTT